MLVRSYLKWSSQAPSPERAEATVILARAYLHASLSPEDRYEAEAALTLALDDPSALVRRALAEVMAAAVDAPPHIVAGLAADQSDVSALVLARSPLLSDEQLVDCAALGDSLAQVAVAMRAQLSGPVAAALAEIAGLEALVVLVRNVGAEIPDFSFQRMIERFGADGAFREALLERPGLPIAIRRQLVDAVAASLSAFVTDAGWVPQRRAERLVQDARDCATLGLVADCDDDMLLDLVAHLRSAGQLTPSLILRALLGGDRRLLVAALSELSALPFRRVAGIVYERGSSAFSALYRKAGMPLPLEKAFVAALASIARTAPVASGSLSLQRRIIMDVRLACRADGGAEAGALAALLLRLDAEAARQEAREITAEILAAAEPVTMAEIAAGMQLDAMIAAERLERESAMHADQAEPAVTGAAVLEPEAPIDEDAGEVSQAEAARVDGDGLLIPFDPAEYALRHAA